jgi:hypothetical protein
MAGEFLEHRTRSEDYMLPSIFLQRLLIVFLIGHNSSPLDVKIAKLYGEVAL